MHAYYLKMLYFKLHGTLYQLNIHILHLTEAIYDLQVVDLYRWCLKLLRDGMYHRIYQFQVIRESMQTKRFFGSTSKVNLNFMYRYTVSDTDRLCSAQAYITLQRHYMFQQSSSYNNQEIKSQYPRKPDSEGIFT